MNEVDPKQEERKAAWGDLKAKVKKKVGATIGSESLVAAGKIQHAEAEAHRSAAELASDAELDRDRASERFEEKQDRIAEARVDADTDELVRLNSVEAARRARELQIDEETTSQTNAARLFADANRERLAQEEQDAAREREIAGREAAAQRESATEARKVAAELDAADQK